MPIVKKKSIELAIDNIAKYGDTDIFSFSFESHIFFDKRNEVIELLVNVDKLFDDYIRDYPITFEHSLASVGYTGFRRGTQIDPLWNAYLLALVIEVGRNIEDTRIPTAEKKVFSYRFLPDQTEKFLFDKKYGWKDFHQQSLLVSKSFSHAVVCDISDFYPRLPHHRLENALRRVTDNMDAVNRIKKILEAISRNVSFGLPVGGPAARLLSELLLNNVDQLLRTENIAFCRFVDDYSMFANSQEEAHS